MRRKADVPFRPARALELSSGAFVLFAQLAVVLIEIAADLKARCCTASPAMAAAAFWPHPKARASISDVGSLGSATILGTVLMSAL
jgi:hypothetical protein